MYGRTLAYCYPLNQIKQRVGNFSQHPVSLYESGQRRTRHASKDSNHFGASPQRNQKTTQTPLLKHKTIKNVVHLLNKELMKYFGPSFSHLMNQVNRNNVMRTVPMSTYFRSLFPMIKHFLLYKVQMLKARKMFNKLTRMLTRKTTLLGLFPLTCWTRDLCKPKQFISSINKGRAVISQESTWIPTNTNGMTKVD